MMLLLPSMPSSSVSPFNRPIFTSSKPIKFMIRCNQSNKKQQEAMKCNPSRRNPSYGRSGSSAIKKSFSQEQVVLTAPIPEDPHVGIIGGGMSGLVCALYLEKRGIRSTVFDTGIHGVGGTTGTRVIDPQPLIFDHTAQLFTTTDPEFGMMVDKWCKNDLVRQWQGTIGTLEKGGRLIPLPPAPPRYIGVNGMHPLAESIISEVSMVDVKMPCWVSTLEPFNGMWHVKENGKPCGQFDAVIIAHNVKCANRLLASSGLPLKGHDIGQFSWTRG